MKPGGNGPTSIAAVLRGIATVLTISSIAWPSLEAVAQPFPSKRVTLIVPYAPGGIVDLIGRTLASRLSERFGQPVVIENRPSVTGLVGVAAGAQAAPDGYTATLLANANLIANMTTTQPTFDIERDFAPVAQVAEYYAMLVVKPSVQARNMAELIALLKAKPGGLSFGSAGIGSSAHIGIALLSQMTGVDVLHVPYKGEGPAITALLTGEIDMAYLTLSGAGAQLKAGKVRGLGVTSAKRVAEFPDIPAIAETVPGFEHLAWVGIVVPAGTPRDRVDFLSGEVNSALRMPDVRQILISRSFEIVGGTPDEFRRRIRTDSATLVKLVRTLGIKTE